MSNTTRSGVSLTVTGVGYRLTRSLRDPRRNGDRAPALSAAIRPLDSANPGPFQARPESRAARTRWRRSPRVKGLASACPEKSAASPSGSKVRM